MWDYTYIYHVIRKYLQLISLLHLYMYKNISDRYMYKTPETSDIIYSL